MFSEYNELFPAVQLQVDRSYGSRVVEAVMENIADFGMTQLPVEEKRLQVVNIHRDEIRLIVPARHPLAEKKVAFAQDVLDHYPLLLPKYGMTRTRLNEWFELVEDYIQHLHGARFHRDDEALRDGGAGHFSFLAVSNCREEIAAGKLRAAPAGAGTDDAAAGA